MGDAEGLRTVIGDGAASVLAIGGCGGVVTAAIQRRSAATGRGRYRIGNCGNGTLNVTFAQDGCSVDGVWSTDFAIPACDALGPLQGNVTKDSLDASGSGCSLDVNGVVDSVNQISGNFTPHSGYQVNGSGTFSITRASPVTPTPSVTATPSADAFAGFVI